MNSRIVTLPESGSTGPEVTTLSVPSSVSATSTGIILVENRPRTHAFVPSALHAPLTVLAVAALPFFDVLQPLHRRRELETIVSNVITAGDILIGDFAVEVEPILTVTPTRPTLWFPKEYAVPLLRWKPFISSFRASDEDE